MALCNLIHSHGNTGQTWLYLILIIHMGTRDRHGPVQLMNSHGTDTALSNLINSRGNMGQTRLYIISLIHMGTRDRHGRI